MNIMINNYCNLNCEYCFANKIIEKDKQNMSVAAFKQAIDFIKRSKRNNLSILGGEPTLHPDFIEFLDIIKNDKDILSLHVFSNGIFTEKILDAFVTFSKIKKLSFLINYNLPEILKEREYIIKKNIMELKKNNVEITLGINIYKRHQENQYLIDACHEFNINKIRWALVVPNSIKTARIDVKRYFSEFSKDVYKFLDKCSKNDLDAHVDCNNIPICMISDKDIRRLAYDGNKNLKVSACHPIIDILPDLSVVRCFALSDNPIKLSNFNNSEEIKDYFEKNVDDKLLNKELIPECLECSSYKFRNKSCGCLAYKFYR
ncbi:MAG TPA: radical SAM protein [Spirochaetota bacterium]|nr:radical SAM protein [Spirochaetota bacterium]